MPIQILRLWCLILLTFSTAYSWVQVTESASHWYYCDKYTKKFLTLRENGSFTYHFYSCKGSSSSTGSYQLYGDTIHLNAEFSDEVFLRRGNQILTYRNMRGMYEAFQPLTYTKDTSLKDICPRYF